MHKLLSVAADLVLADQAATFLEFLGGLTIIVALGISFWTYSRHPGVGAVLSIRRPKETIAAKYFSASAGIWAWAWIVAFILRRRLTVKDFSPRIFFVDESTKSFGHTVAETFLYASAVNPVFIGSFALWSAIGSANCGALAFSILAIIPGLYCLREISGPALLLFIQ
jgi:hypothetical protein